MIGGASAKGKLKAMLDALLSYNNNNKTNLRKYTKSISYNRFTIKAYSFT